MERATSPQLVMEPEPKADDVKEYVDRWVAQAFQICDPGTSLRMPFTIFEPEIPDPEAAWQVVQRLRRLGIRGKHALVTWEGLPDKGTARGWSIYLKVPPNVH